MKIKVLVLLCLSAALFLGGCKGSDANANANANANKAAVATPTPVVVTNEAAKTDPNLGPKITEALKKGGFTDVTVDTSGPKVVLRGTVAKGKLGEVMKAAMEANGGKPVDNQVTEK